MSVAGTSRTFGGVYAVRAVGIDGTHGETTPSIDRRQKKRGETCSSSPM